MLKFKGSKAFSVVELLIVSCVIFVLVGVFGIYANRLLVEARKVALKHELAALRLKLKLFKILYDKDPGSIQEFFEAERGRLDGKGNLLDPFGNIYIYNSENCIVMSSTPGYKDW